MVNDTAVSLRHWGNTVTSSGELGPLLSSTHTRCKPGTGTLAKSPLAPHGATNMAVWAAEERPSLPFILVPWDCGNLGDLPRTATVP
jgi:hypothetical protein